jgi:CheY-like chemotaxis protein
MKSPLTTEKHLATRQALAALAPDPRTDDSSIKKLYPAQKGPTVLIVDQDLGFLYWLGCTLSDAGYLPLPALNCEDAGDLLRRLSLGIDLLVVDSSIPGANELVTALERSQKDVRVIAVIGDEGKSNPGLPSADASQYRRPCSEDSLEAVWLETVRVVIASPDTRQLLPD